MITDIRKISNNTYDVTRIIGIGADEGYMSENL
jgi:hypothetical protein